MANEYLYMNAFLGVTFGTATNPTSTQVDSLWTEAARQFKNRAGRASAVTTDDADMEIVQLMCAIKIARAYRAINGFANTIQTPNGVYSFSEQLVKDWKDELAECLENAGHTILDGFEAVNPLASAGYDDR